MFVTNVLAVVANGGSLSLDILLRVEDQEGNPVRGASVLVDASGGRTSHWYGSLIDLENGWYQVCDVGFFVGPSVSISVIAQKPGYIDGQYQARASYGDICAEATPTNTNTPASTPTPTSTVCAADVNYTIAQSDGGTIVPGRNELQGVQPVVTLDFPFVIYGHSSTTAAISRQGNIQFLGNIAGYQGGCLPRASGFGWALFPHNDNFSTDPTISHILTSVTGVAPNRTYNIEWRTAYTGGAGRADFEVRLYEGQRRFDFVYGQLDRNGANALVGVQGLSAGVYTQFSCGTTNLYAGLVLAFTQQSCGTATPTPTNTDTPTETPSPCPLCPTFTSTSSATPSITRTGIPTFTPTLTNTPSNTPTITPTFTSTATATSTVCGVGSWRPRAPYPQQIQGEALETLGGIIYSFGGYSGSNVATAISYKYNLSQNTWTTIAPLPVARRDASAVTDGTYIYILNGADGSGNGQSNLYRYDPTTDSYSTLPPSPEGTLAQGAVYVSGKIYRIAGCISQGLPCPATSSIDVYTVSTNSWAPDATVSPYPQAVGWPRIAVSGGYIYSAGGALSTPAGGDSLKTYRYSPATDTWDDGSISDLPEAREWSAGAIYNGRWLLASGDMIGLDMQDPGGPWVTLPAQPAPRYFGAGVSNGSAFYTVGGHDANWTVWAETQHYAEGPCPTITPRPQVCEPVNWMNAVYVSVSMTTIQKTGGANSTWDAGASSDRAIASGDGYVLASVDTTNSYRIFVSLMATPTRELLMLILASTWRAAHSKYTRPEP